MYTVYHMHILYPQYVSTYHMVRQYTYIHMYWRTPPYWRTHLHTDRHTYMYMTVISVLVYHTYIYTYWQTHLYCISRQIYWVTQYILHSCHVHIYLTYVPCTQWLYRCTSHTSDIYDIMYDICILTDVLLYTSMYIYVYSLSTRYVHTVYQYVMCGYIVCSVTMYT